MCQTIMYFVKCVIYILQTFIIVKSVTLETLISLKLGIGVGTVNNILNLKIYYNRSNRTFRFVMFTTIKSVDSKC